MKSFFIIYGVIILTLRIESTESNCNGCSGKLKLMSDGPAIFDAPISINATLENAHDFEGPFYFTFLDDVSPIHYHEFKSKDGMQTNTISYPYKEYDIEGNVFEIVMTVRVYVTQFIFYRKKIATGQIRYSITKSLNGKLDVTQINRTINIDEDKYSIVSTQNITKLNVDLHDPHGFLSNVSINYFWFVNTTLYGSTNGTLFEYNIKEPSVTQFEALVIAHIPNKLSNVLSHEIAKRNASYEYLKTYSTMNDEITRANRFSTKVDARTPMKNFTISDDDTVLKHGEMLNLPVTCDGSGPWRYCYYFQNNVSESYNKSCDNWNHIPAGKCVFYIQHWFPKNGIHGVIIVVDDGLTKIKKEVAITVITGPSTDPISFIFVPVTSAILAVAAFIAAIFVFFNYKQNMRGRETANFDFISNQDESLEFKTFWERIRDDMHHLLGRIRQNSETENLIVETNEHNTYDSTSTDNNEII